MDLQSLKWWLWGIIGGIAGLLVGWAVLSQRQEQRIGGAGFMSQAEFEQELGLRPLGGNPRLKNFLIYQVGVVDVVEMERLSTLAGSSKPVYLRWKFAAPLPYKPQRIFRSVGPGYSVRDFMQDIIRADPQIKFQFAWWRQTPAVLSAWAGGGIILIGGLWPIMIRLLIGAGLCRGAPAEAPYDLGRFKSEPQAAPSPAPSAQDAQRLAELEKEMLESLQKKGSSDSPADAAVSPSTPPAPAIASMDGGPLLPLEAPPPEDKHYEGQYYPVARPESHPESHEPPPSGFSLVELLVVIAIIAILISLLMPAVRSATQSAQQVKCATQLREIYAALLMYSNANKGWLPEWSAYHTWPRGLADDTPGSAWTEELIPYLGSPDGQIYKCPSFPGPQRFRNYFLAARWSGLSGRSAMKLTDVKMTGRFVLSGDKTQRGLYLGPFGTLQKTNDDSDPDDLGRSGSACLSWPWQEGGFWMHRYGNNVLFDDGHVVLFGAYDRISMTFHPTQMQDWIEVTPGL